MRFEAWSDWRQVAETFVAERAPAQPEQTVDVLVLLLRRVGSWADFLGGGWIWCAATEVYVHYVKGYGPSRTYALIDRLAGWLHARGDLDDWSRDVLHAATDEGREAHGLEPRRPHRVRELCFDDHQRDEILASFRMSVPEQSPADVAWVGRLVVHVCEAMHGPSHAPPLGALDPDRLVAAALSQATPTLAASRVGLAAAFYRWLGATERLEPARAAWVASRLEAAALGLAVPPGERPSA